VQKVSGLNVVDSKVNHNGEDSAAERRRWILNVNPLETCQSTKKILTFLEPSSFGLIFFFNEP
jgi:GTP:adenosylcobinamide-phosphate guanylyltransferase